MIASESRLRELMVRGQSGDGPAYHLFLKEMSGVLRAYFRRRLGGLPDEVEDLVQETLLAIHNQRHTYDPAQPLTPGRMPSPATSWWTCCAGAARAKR